MSWQFRMFVVALALATVPCIIEEFPLNESIQQGPLKKRHFSLWKSVHYNDGNKVRWTSKSQFSFEWASAFEDTYPPLAFGLMYVYAGFELAGCKYTSVKRSIVNDSCHPDDYVDRLNLNVDSNRKQNQTNNNRKCERSKETATTKKCYQFYLFQIASCKWHRKKAYPHESPKQIVDAEPFCECACNFFYGRIKLNGWKHHSSKSK